MPLISLELPAGVYRNGTKLQSKGRWYDANMIRWRNGRMRPIGGWEQTTTTALADAGRSMKAWKDNNGNKLLAIGTATKLYIYEGNTGTPLDATPANFNTGRTTALAGLGYGSGPFNGIGIEKTIAGTDIAVSNSTTITSTSTDFRNYFSAPDLIQASGFSNSANNKTYPNSHSVTAVAQNSLTIDGSLTPESAGAVITLSKARGFGEDLSSGTSLIFGANTWSFDVWGEYLIALSKSDGKIYEFRPSYLPNNPATVIPNAPIQNAGIVVSKERYLIAIGAGNDPRRVSWSDQEINSTWSPSATNSAGGFQIDSSGELQVALKVGDRILMWTDVDCHALDYVGPPYVFGRRKIGDACGVISPQSVVSFRGISAWMSNGQFWTYDGIVKPLRSDVQSYVFDDINLIQKSKIHATTNQKFGEIWWFYCSKNSDEIDRYVIWNYAENWWSIGVMPRTSFIDSGVYEKPLALGTNHQLYEHESDPSSDPRPLSIGPPSSASDMCLRDRKLYKGTSSTGETGFVYAESGPFEVGIGERRVQGNQLITDTDAGNNGLRFAFKQQATPEDTETTSDTYDIATDGYTDIRVQGREVSFKVDSPFDQNWDIGNIKMDAKVAGKR